MLWRTLHAALALRSYFPLLFLVPWRSHPYTTAKIHNLLKSVAVLLNYLLPTEGGGGGEGEGAVPWTDR